jgi:arylsulfatase A-like enzyme
VPLIICGFSKEARDKRNNYFVNFIDLAPTFMDLAGVKNQPAMDGKSLVPILKGEKPENRDQVFLERERHCLCRAEMNNGAGYPMRAIRTNDYLYIRNFRPNRSPAGDETIPGTPSEYGDVDGGITKIFMMDNRNNPLVKPFFELGFGKRPAEELYILKDDPYNLHNVAAEAQYSAVKADMQKRLGQWMKDSNDPRLNGKGDQIDSYDATTHAWITRDGMILLDKK